MTSAIFSDGRISEAEFLAIEEAPERVELFDGSLHVTPNPTTRHQFITTELWSTLKLCARDSGFHALLGINVRLRPDRIAIPDLVIASDVTFGELIVDASSIRLACEVISPSNAATDKVLKMHYYATAGIPWYLLVDQETGTLHLHKLAGETYAEHAVAEAGDVLRLAEPVVAVIDPQDLLPPD